MNEKSAPSKFLDIYFDGRDSSSGEKVNEVSPATPLAHTHQSRTRMIGEGEWRPRSLRAADVAVHQIRPRWILEAME
jgi:hypothetical protein